MLSVGEICSLVGVVFAIGGALMVVWRVTWTAAVVSTTLTLRVASLEKGHTDMHEGYKEEFKALERSIEKLTEAVWRLRGNWQAAEARDTGRASQGDFDRGADTDPPRRDR